MRLRAGDWVEVRSKKEILSTLDKRGQLEGLPFMPQMFKYCGKRYQVYKRAHKTCDTVNVTGGRRIRNGVHLDLRCDGEAYGGCQALCLIFWKEEWLKKVYDEKNKGADAVYNQANESPSGGSKVPVIHSSDCTEADVWAGTKVDGSKSHRDATYICQATQLPYFTTLLPWWDFRQYLEDYTSGNITLKKLLLGALYAGYNLPLRAGIGLGKPMQWLYDCIKFIFRGNPYPRKTGNIPVGKQTPTLILNLKPGEYVRIRPFNDILSTLNTLGYNRGLRFDAEQVPYCGSVYMVKARVDKIVDEKTGKIITLKNPAIILDGVVCQARYSYCRMFCPRSLYTWWREIWLERVMSGNGDNHPGDAAG